MATEMTAGGQLLWPTSRLVGEVVGTKVDFSVEEFVWWLPPLLEFSMSCRVWTVLVSESGQWYIELVVGGEL